MLSRASKTCGRFAHALYRVAKSESAFPWSRRLLTTMSSETRKVEERKIKVDDKEINYVRVGKGDHPVLLLPGALGTIWTDWKPQIETMDADKLTIVAWDPPGYGKSRPPDRTFPDDFFYRDAVYAHNLMKTLGYSIFSLVGWSDGGITSLILAAKYPDSIRKTVVLGANAYIHPDETKIYDDIRNIETWSPKMRDPMIEAYGKEYFQKTWSDWVDAMIGLYKKKDGDLCKEELPKIKCPTLIIHGEKDSLVLPEHPIYLKEKIPNSRLVIPKGSHNLHLRYPEETNKLITEFLTESDKLEQSKM
ncbi:valacyclovir hydrolase [Pseudomyrmex gracilis]|uniref:valacyclovir hydrolase n=1 Tax=Pseudomyrmex gracilis TaxID=219809 RepID=UPI00099589C8|nr:valacyclovir hydrolase [Pseudomyrmex gracilis]XP_020284145.1 valacyclovir hydrolase [Pseudomyrmex gracilis]